MVLKRFVETEQLLRTKDICRMLNVAQGTVLNMVRDGRLKVVRLGPKSFRYRPSDVAAAFNVDLQLVQEAA